MWKPLDRLLKKLYVRWFERRTPGYRNEVIFLAMLARSSYLSRFSRHMEGAALIITLTREPLICEVVVEVRLQGGVGRTTTEIVREDLGHIWVYLQNRSDTPLQIKMPEYLLTSGLHMPWKTGMEFMVAPMTGEWGEALTWIVAIKEAVDRDRLGEEVAIIADKCVRIMETTANRLQE